MPCSFLEGTLNIVSSIGQSGKSSGGMRAGAANLTTPACTTGSIKKISERLGFEPRVPFYQDNRLAGGSIRPTLASLQKI